ncbi:MAG: hypothetical protein QNJ69_07275 [Gammaproteobacteria bacterium]|nr:hypothetical protein [Gammaproteobacteria bacterium]
MLIIFIQIDRGYKLPSYYQEQDDIIRQTYQKETRVSATAEVITPPIGAPVKQEPAAPAEVVAIAPQSYQPAPTSAVTPLPATTNNYSQKEQAPLPYDILFDSPWSPYYQPQHFESMR